MGCEAQRSTSDVPRNDLSFRPGQGVEGTCWDAGEIRVLRIVKRVVMVAEDGAHPIAIPFRDFDDDDGPDLLEKNASPTEGVVFDALDVDLHQIRGKVPSQEVVERTGGGTARVSRLPPDWETPGPSPIQLLAGPRRSTFSGTGSHSDEMVTAANSNRTSCGSGRRWVLSRSPTSPRSGSAASTLHRARPCTPRSP